MFLVNTVECLLFGGITILLQLLACIFRHAEIDRRQYITVIRASKRSWSQFFNPILIVPNDLVESIPYFERIECGAWHVQDMLDCSDNRGLM
ncbi:MAG: hypothetical protein D4R79_05120 [Comamonadaceae bacterium]|nr:MAG: hypothetical protein D4R79_05120 [Comamonadaceae bacterium]